ncbi:MAG: tetratricopeptide repeat protein [Eubacterium sp.]|nr:tetratricopeptide repeat protein [Eubacterium sp.]
MICYNCGNILTNSDYCSHCGMDVSVYKRIVKLSNTYYNAGITKARNRDLAGAADVLRRSVKLNKRNVDARNLLGLVYFEMGETVQAFSEWVMSTNIQPDNNPADRYLVAIEHDKTKVDELNHTIKKFNIALEYANEGTDDMAIIQLKKVLNQNPKFIKASQLLCLLYMKNGQYERAKRTILKSLKIDKCNPLSIRYLREVNMYMEEERKNDPEKRMNRRRRLKGTMVDRPYLSGDDVIMPKHSFKDAITGGQSILYVIIGLLLGAALIYFVVTPAKMAHVTDTVNEAKVDYNKKMAVKNTSMGELQDKVKSLEKEKNQLDSKLAKFTDSDNTIADNYNYLLEAVDDYLQEDYDAAAKSLAKVDGDMKMNSEAFDSVYKKMSKKLSGKISGSAYDAGMEAMNTNDYNEAIKQFNKCLKVDKSNTEAMYYLAWAYKHNGDDTNAKKWFKEIAENYEGSDYYDEAKTQYEDMGGGSNSEN